MGSQLTVAVVASGPIRRKRLTPEGLLALGFDSGNTITSPGVMLVVYAPSREASISFFGLGSRSVTVVAATGVGFGEAVKRLEDDWAHRRPSAAAGQGSEMVRTVPCPGLEATSNVPPRSSMRSRMFCTPAPLGV